jgi:hypothetical protein
MPQVRMLSFEVPSNDNRLMTLELKSCATQAWSHS